MGRWPWLAGARGRHGFAAAQANAAQANAAINSLRVLAFDDAHVEHRRIGDHDDVAMCCTRGGSL